MSTGVFIDMEVEFPALRRFGVGNIMEVCTAQACVVRTITGVHVHYAVMDEVTDPKERAKIKNLQAQLNRAKMQKNKTVVRYLENELKSLGF